METEIRPLYYVGKPTDAARQALREGKELLGVHFLVQPTPVTDAVDQPVLAFEEPRFYVDAYALLTPPYTATRMAAALREIYGLVPPDHLTTGAEWLARHLGDEVKFLGEEDA